MHRFLLLLGIGFVAIYLESAILAAWPVPSLRFELVWVILLFAAFSSPLLVCGPLAVLLGFMKDLAGTPFLGLFASIYFFGIIVLRAFIQKMFIETLWARVLWIGIFTILASAMEWGLLEIAHYGEGLRQHMIVYTVPQCLLNMLLATLLLPFLDRVAVFKGSLYDA
jgi:rod shape-determining protein MreD